MAYKTDEITNDEDVIDSREIIERIAYLEGFEDEDLDEDEAEELKNLLALQNEAEGYSDDWQYGSTLIRESYFVEYCKEMLQDIGDLPKDLPLYIESNIDWEGVAEDLKVDYTEVGFDGVSYFVR